MFLVIKALAWCFYGNSVDVKNRENVIDCAILAANIIKEKDNSEKGKYLHLISSIFFERKMFTKQGLNLSIRMYVQCYIR